MRFSRHDFDCQNLRQNPLCRFSRTMPAAASWTGDEFWRRSGARRPEGVIFDTKSRWRMSHLLVPASLLPGADADPREEEKEGEMNPHGRCAEAADGLPAARDSVLFIALIFTCVVL